MTIAASHGHRQLSQGANRGRQVGIAGRRLTGAQRRQGGFSLQILPASLYYQLLPGSSTAYPRDVPRILPSNGLEKT
jgi:hypothetical protein